MLSSFQSHLQNKISPSVFGCRHDIPLLSVLLHVIPISITIHFVKCTLLNLLLLMLYTTFEHLKIEVMKLILLAALQKLPIQN